MTAPRAQQAPGVNLAKATFGDSLLQDLSGRTGLIESAAFGSGDLPRRVRQCW